MCYEILLVFGKCLLNFIFLFEGMDFRSCVEVFCGIVLLGRFFVLLYFLIVLMIMGYVVVVVSFLCLCVFVMEF